MTVASGSASMFQETAHLKPQRRNANVGQLNTGLPLLQSDSSFRAGFPQSEAFRPETFQHSCTRVRGPPVGLHVSRYTCRSRSPQNPRIFQVWQRYRATPPLKGPVAPVAVQLPRVSHVKLPLQRCRATGGCSSYTCGCRATLCTYAFQPKWVCLTIWRLLKV